MKLFRRGIFALFLFFLFAVPAFGAEADWKAATIESTELTVSRLSDGSRSSYTSSDSDAAVTVSREDGISAIYIEFDRTPTPWKLKDPASGSEIACGENAFLHEYIDVKTLLGGTPNSLSLTFPAGTVIADIYAFSEGELPSWVQTWEPPCKEADLLLISSHSDDEQLFFAGILPYYTMERKLNVQVAYIVQHFEVSGWKDHQRPHEQLDGLWTVGVRNYPVMSDFPDLYAESKDRATAFRQAEAAFGGVGVTFDDFIAYITRCLRQFKPLVTISHDLDGEYGHGTHVFCAAALTEAINAAADPSRYPESAAEYGTWQVEKTYLHLYEENPLVFELIDTPLESMGGKTPFEMTQEGFGCHKSQHWTWFYQWIYGSDSAPITKASQISGYSPLYYGLYDSKVGPDVIGGDFFENVETYEMRAIAAAEAEAARKAEEERLAAEQKAKEEEERQRLELEQKAAEELKKTEKELERIQKEKEELQRKITVTSVCTVAAAVIATVLMVLRRKLGRKQ